MKNKLIKLISATIAIISLASCNKPIKAPESLDEVLSNSKYYNIYFSANDGRKIYHELNGEGYYSYIPNQYGYIISDFDPGYTHFFSLKRDESDLTIHLNMNGRNCDDKQFDTAAHYGRVTFMDILEEYSDLFEQDENDPWKYYTYSYHPASDFKNFFQLSEFAYCDYYEIDVGKDGKISKFLAGESYDDEYGKPHYIITETINVESISYKDLYFYKEWVQNGKQEEIRLVDYKAFYPSGRGYKTCYQSGELECIVTSIDYDGSFYVANQEDHHGPIGMKVNSKNPINVSIGDKVKVKGDIQMDVEGIYTASCRFVNAEVSVIDHNNPLPQFDEESIVDQMGAGAFATNMIVSSPIYGGSLYSGYGYASKIPTAINTEGDTIVEILCPDFFYQSTSTPFQMELHLPYEYGEDKINTVLEECRKCGDYSANPEECELISFKNIISYFSFDRELSLDLYALPSSLISHRLSYVETIDYDYNYKDFPELKAETSGFFHFGDNAGWLIESQYNIKSDNHLDGVFSFYQGANMAKVEQYFNELEAYGAQRVDIYSLYMTSYTLHYVYSYNDLFIDVMFDNYAGVVSQVQIFIYRSETLIRCKTIQEKIDDACGNYFKGEEFIKLEGTYEKDYHFYTLPNFAGNKFDQEHPLHVATLDITENRYEELRKAYRDAGWKQYRNEDNTAYSYNTRGVNRVVYYKENANGKKTFLDFCAFPVTDYTFLRCETFDPRIEIAIYEGDAPLKTVYTRDLNQFMKDATIYAKSYYFDWTLPEKYKAELYYADEGDFFEYDYGYCYRTTNAFIYPEIKSEAELDILYDYVLDTIKDHGFEWAFDGKQGVNYKAEEENPNDMYAIAYIYVQKNYKKGYVRILSGIGGLDF